MVDAIAFMVMPFNRKATARTEPDVPTEIDFDALWERVYQPVLQRLGYTAVRADRDTGALIIAQMIQRLAIADLVVADITIPNANVYYEIGVRHAASRTGCVLVAADWARPVFDLGQMRQLRFPLSDGEIGPEAARAATEGLGEGLAALRDGDSPVYEAVPGYPGKIAVDRVSAFREAVAALSDFDAEVRAARAAPDAQRAQRTRAILDQHGAKRVVREAVVLDLLRLIRDNLGWDDTLAYIASLPEQVARQPLVHEQRALALCKAGSAAEAIGSLEELIAREGETSERCGLLGGRYKVLMREATTPRERRRYLERAIESYERGMLLDLNDYYPAGNLVGLYRERGEPGDDVLAADAQAVTAVACRAALTLGRADEWTIPTLLNLAFDRGDVLEARRLQRDIERQDHVGWQIESTLKDLDATAARHAGDVRAELEAILEELRAP